MVKLGHEIYECYFMYSEKNSYFSITLEQERESYYFFCISVNYIYFSVGSKDKCDFLDMRWILVISFCML